MVETKKKIISKLQFLLENKVEFVIIFGSLVRDGFNKNSDIDVGIFLKKPLKNLSEKLGFIYDLSKEFVREMDVIFLNDSDIIITMQVLANGEVIVNNNLNEFILFKSLKIGQYIDFKMDRKIIEDNLLNGRIYA